MYLKRMKIRGTRGFNLDLPLDGNGTLPEASRKRLLLQGGNGSGKTTVLEIVAGLWGWFGEMIDSRNSHFRISPSTIWSAELNAMELGDFPIKGASFWIAVGSLNAINDLKKDFPETPKAIMQSDGRISYVELPLGDWKTSKLRSQEGVEPLPNIVYFPPEGRSPKHPTGDIKRLDLYTKNWLTHYSPTDPTSDLDSLLFTVRARSKERFIQAVQLFNLILLPGGKRISEQEGREGRMQIERVEEPRPPAHLWTSLSSGERQMLLLIVYTVCLLREDSILLIDEPDLHIHMSMVTQLLQMLDYICQQRRCQFIVTSHSELVWDFFGRQEEQIELGGWRGNQP